MSQRHVLMVVVACATMLSLFFAATAGAALEETPGAPRVPQRALRAAAPNDRLWHSEWGIIRDGGAGLWKWGHGSPRVVVAVVDTGVDASNVDLRGRVVPGWNAITGSTNTSDDNGHGTMAAGIIAARGGNHVGIAGYCWLCSIMPVKVLDAGGQGSGTTIAAGIEWAVAHRATIVNLSFALDHADPGVARAVADAVAHGIIVVAAAGNVGGSDLQYPAAYPGVISTGAVDSGGALYPWSTFGSWTRVTSPGCNQTTTLGGSFGEFCGSSSAAAALSGLLSLAASDAPTSLPRLGSLLGASTFTALRRVDGIRFLAAAVNAPRRRK